jgi:serine/threonine protein kinase
MPIVPGTRLGPYEVTALIGEGGMGKAWQGHHTALKRDDVLKVLSDTFPSDPEPTGSIRRERASPASLTHPHIADTYGLNTPSREHLMDQPGSQIAPCGRGQNHES